MSRTPDGVLAVAGKSAEIVFFDYIAQPVPTDVINIERVSWPNACVLHHFQRFRAIIIGDRRPIPLQPMFLGHHARGFADSRVPVQNGAACVKCERLNQSDYSLRSPRSNSLTVIKRSA